MLATLSFDGWCCIDKDLLSSDHPPKQKSAHISFFGGNRSIDYGSSREIPHYSPGLCGLPITIAPSQPVPTVIVGGVCL